MSIWCRDRESFASSKDLCWNEKLSVMVAKGWREIGRRRQAHLHERHEGKTSTCSQGERCQLTLLHLHAI